MSEQAAVYRGPRNDSYETPPWLWDQLNEQYNFSVDLAASQQNAKCAEFYSTERSFLACQGWLGVGWLNCPFSLASPFAVNLAHLCGRGCKAVTIYKSCNMETQAWQHMLSACSWIAVPDRRVNYYLGGVEQKGVQFGSALVGFNVPEPHIATREGWHVLTVRR